jgi:hypothetical protein
MKPVRFVGRARADLDLAMQRYRIAQEHAGGAKRD